VTLHTVLERPNPDQRRVMDEILTLSSSVVVMAEKGADILARVHRAGPAKVHVIPHGAPDRPLSPTEPFKALLGLAGRRTIMTFGLLSPNKGIETIIKALPRVRERHPDVVYMIVGATHPHLVAREGEAYRDGLVTLARSLGVEQCLHFVNRYVGDAELVDLLQAADIYATPYLTETQITSGTLSYAIALGKPIVSTPYWHAVEALADGVGAICPFDDVDAFARELTDLLSNDVRRKAMSRRAWTAGSASRWPNVGASYLDLAAGVRAVHIMRPQPTLRALTRPSMTAVRRLIDDVGMMQHAKLRVPDRAHGYCIDDTARALALFAHLARDGDQGEAGSRCAYVCAAFVNHAWNEETGRFRNFMSWDRRWLDDGGCHDCNGRTFEALCLTAANSARPDLRDWATDLGRRVYQRSADWTSHRARAHVIKGCIVGDGLVIDPRECRDTLAAASGALLAALNANAPWFDPKLAYDNALLPEALILAGQRLGDSAMLATGLSALEWLMDRQSAGGGRFRPIATSGFALGDATHAAFDQQPIEALASVEACVSAFEATGEEAWRRRATAAFMWFAGENDLGLPLITLEDGGCHDGLTATGCNRNQGAESVLSYHLASARMRSLGESRTR